MAPVQQTFSLIPEPPSAHNGGEAGRMSLPPMTTKQAKKAYKAKNKGPKLSKAEQRRQDLMEQDRIRREFEKERNQARAKASRDKRKEKEEKAKFDKKRKGLPLVEVHPSQDTLARFVKKPEPPKTLRNQEIVVKKSQEHKDVPKTQETLAPPLALREGYESDRTLSAGDEPERPVKRQRTGPPPKISPASEHVPDGMFKHRRHQSEPGIQHMPVELSSNTMVISRMDPIAETSSFDPDDPSTDQMVNQQILNESFSADDGLFDGIDMDAIDMDAIDMDAIDMETLAQDSVHTKKNTPPSKPPGRSQLPGEQEQEKNSAQSVTMDQTRATSTRILVPDGFEYGDNLDITEARSETKVTKDINRARDSKMNSTTNRETSYHPQTHWPSLSGPPVDGKDGEQAASRQACITNVAPAQVKLPSKADSKYLQPNTNQKPAVSHNALKQPRGLLVVAEKQSRKILKEFSLNGGTDPTPNGIMPGCSIAFREEQRPLERTLKSPFRRAQATFSKPVFGSPKTPTMGPPPQPPKFKTTTQSTHGKSANIPKFLPQRTPSCGDPKRHPESSNVSGPPAQMPPSSTQLFLLSNADDLFPSPSQEVAEIFECPPRGQTPSIRPRTAPTPAPPRFMPPPSCDRPKTSTDMSRTLASRAVARAKEIGVLSTQMDSHGSPAIQGHLPTAQNIDYMPFLSTQDVMLSSQDLMELGEESPAHEALSKLVNNTARNDCSSTSHFRHEFPRQPKRDNTTISVEKQHITRTLDTKGSTKISPLISTQDRILGPHHQSQQSSLPDTPSMPSRKTSTFCNKAQLRPSFVGGVLMQKDISMPVSSFTDDEIAELLDAGLESDHDEFEPLHVEQATKVVGQQTPIGVRPSPKPFFTSSGSKEKVYLAIEKTRTMAWKDKQAHRQAEEDLNVLLREEDEKQERLLLEKMLDAEGTTSPLPEPVSLSGRQIDESARNSLDKHRGDSKLRSQKSNAGNENARRRSLPQSQFDKMLQMLDKSKSSQASRDASHESDYGDDAWDDNDLADL